MKVSRVCQTCAKEFFSYPSQPRKYCSRVCKDKSHTSTIFDVLLKIVLCAPSTLETGCWRYPYTFNNGYGRNQINKKSKTTHILIYNYFVGSVPDGYVLHHRCENKCCCNYEHLEVLTHKEHIARHINKNNFAKQKLRTHCPLGHPYDKENTYIEITKTGGQKRKCTLCHNIRRRKNA